MPAWLTRRSSSAGSNTKDYTCHTLVGLLFGRITLVLTLSHQSARLAAEGIAMTNYEAGYSGVQTQKTHETLHWSLESTSRNSVTTSQKSSKVWLCTLLIAAGPVPCGQYMTQSQYPKQLDGS